MIHIGTIAIRKYGNTMDMIVIVMSITVALLRNCSDKNGRLTSTTKENIKLLVAKYNQKYIYLQ